MGWVTSRTTPKESPSFWTASHDWRANCSSSTDSTRHNGKRCASSRAPIAIPARPVPLPNLSVRPRARDPIANIEQVAELLTPDVGMAMVRGLTRLLHDLQARHGLKTFGVCGDCNLNCVTTEAVPTKQCGHTGESLDARDMRQICVDFVPCPEGPAGTRRDIPRRDD